MSSDAPSRSGSPLQAARHHLITVAVLVLLGGLAGWLYADTVPASYTSTARILLNPSAGNPFVPTLTGVRQDELTSMETEAQVVRSAEVLGAVTVPGSQLTTATLQEGLEVSVPPNTQVVELSYTADDPTTARRVTSAVASTYLANRARRFENVQAARSSQLSARTEQVLDDLRAATNAAEGGPASQRSFQAELAVALRNELVNLRAQRTALETAEPLAGTLISPASTPQRSTRLVAAALTAGGALAGLLLGCLATLGWERLRRVVRSVAEVEEAGLPVLAITPSPRGRGRFPGQGQQSNIDRIVRWLRSTLLDADPKPSLVTVAPASGSASASGVAQSLAASIAHAGHSAVLVRSRQAGGDLVVEDGLAEVLLHERLDVLGLLQPTADPLLSVLPEGRSMAAARELMTTDRVRTALEPLQNAGSLVVVEGPALDTPEGEAVARAAALGIVVVTLGQTPRATLEQLVLRNADSDWPLVALVLHPHDAAHRTRPVVEEGGHAGGRSTGVSQQRAHTHR